MEVSREELIHNEDVRIKIAMEFLEDYSDLHEKMNRHYLEMIERNQQERREMFKYLGTIAGGAAALSPQLLEHVKQLDFFYVGIVLLSLAVIISVTYVLSSLENNTTALLADRRDLNDLISRLRQPKIDFVRNKDYDVDAFIKAMTSGTEEVFKEKKDSRLKFEWYQPMDYTGEFMVLFTVAGLLLLAGSLTSFSASFAHILWLFIGIFFIINIISTFPDKIFTILGFPIDLLKSLPRLFRIRKSN